MTNQVKLHVGGPYPVSVVSKYFCYDEGTGIVSSRINRGVAFSGKVLGTKDKQGYLVTTLFKRPIKLHRLAIALSYGSWPDGPVDHINGIKSDNRLENLRVLTHAQNKQNIKTPSSNTSGFMGVSFHKASGKWAANIKIDGTSRYLGLYKSAEEASKAYKSAKQEIHPFNEVYK